MIIIPECQACYIHVPRTAGMALQTAIFRACPLSQRYDGSWEHVSAHAVRRVLPAPRYRVFAVMRNPWEIFASHWQWVQLHKNHPESIEDEATRLGLTVESALTFADDVRCCVEHNVLAIDGGFAARYCDPDTRIFRYEHDPWSDIAAWLGCELHMERENESLCDPPAWDQASIDLVGYHCRGDVERFGYEPPLFPQAV